MAYSITHACDLENNYHNIFLFGITDHTATHVSQLCILGGLPISEPCSNAVSVGSLSYLLKTFWPRP